MTPPRAKVRVVLALSMAFGCPDGSAQSRDGGGHPISRTDAVIDAIHRSGAVQRCWNSYLANEPQPSSARVRLRVHVAAAGRIDTATVLDPIPPSLATCVQSAVVQASVPAGAEVTVETTYGFQAGMHAPVPAG